MSDVAINSCWDVDNIGINLVGLEEFGDLDTISQSVCSTDDNETSDTVLLALSGKWLKMTLIKLIF